VKRNTYNGTKGSPPLEQLLPHTNPALPLPTSVKALLCVPQSFVARGAHGCELARSGYTAHSHFFPIPLCNSNISRAFGFKHLVDPTYLMFRQLAE
jgi:hypothetical protein